MANTLPMRAVLPSDGEVFRVLCPTTRSFKDGFGHSFTGE